MGAVGYDRARFCLGRSPPRYIHLRHYIIEIGKKKGPEKIGRELQAVGGSADEKWCSDSDNVLAVGLRHGARGLGAFFTWSLAYLMNGK
jgi:hypothetical protein